MPRWTRYLIVFFLGGITAIIVNPSLFSRNASQLLSKQAAISEGAASVSAIPTEETVRVARVIDGDTVELADGRKIRYIGIDTPEMGDVRTAVACFAREAMEENKRLVEGKTVRLEKDVSEADRYGRLLRYVYSGDGTHQTVRPDVFVNDNLVRQGFARVATFPPDVHYQEQFLEAQREAQEQGRGLWGKKCLH